MTKRFVDYHEYLLSDAWQIRRRMAIEHYKSCALCNSGENLNVHHKHYDTLGEERLEDLTVLCRKCHEWYEKNKRVETGSEMDLRKDAIDAARAVGKKAALFGIDVARDVTAELLACALECEFPTLTQENVATIVQRTWMPLWKRIWQSMSNVCSLNQSTPNHPLFGAGFAYCADACCRQIFWLLESEVLSDTEKEAIKALFAPYVSGWHMWWEEHNATATADSDPI